MSMPSESDEPTHMADDPAIHILLDTGKPNPRLITVARKSRLVQHSGFFRAMFRHEFAETRTSTVTLHDDDPTVLFWVMFEISIGPVPFPQGKWEHTHHRLLEKLRLLLKYDCISLEADAIRAITRCVQGATSEYVWDVDGFFSEHYDLVIDVYGGIYPEKLYKAFSLAWQAFRLRGVPTERMLAVVKINHALAIFLADLYCGKLVEAQGATNRWLKNAEHQNEQSFRKVKESIDEVRKSAEDARAQVESMLYAGQDIAVDMDN